MPRTTTVHAVTAIGIDMGKNTLHMIGLDARGAIVLREKVFPPRSASRKEEMEKGLASAFVIRWPIWPSGPSRE